MLRAFINEAVDRECRPLSGSIIFVTTSVLRVFHTAWAKQSQREMDSNAIYEQ